jgi:hypothetical protein
MAGRLFTAADAWDGFFFELALEVGPRSDDRLRAALAALWQHPDLEGCYLDPGREPSDQPRVPPLSLEDGSRLYGVARLPNGSRVVCGTWLIRQIDDGPDWLDFFLKTGSFDREYPPGEGPIGSEVGRP